MAAWVAQTDRFLTFNERSVLSGPGQVSHEAMESLANGRFEGFANARKFLELEDAMTEELDDLRRVETRPSRPSNPKLPNQNSPPSFAIFAIFARNMSTQCVRLTLTSRPNFLTPTPPTT